MRPWAHLRGYNKPRLLHSHVSHERTDVGYTTGELVFLTFTSALWPRRGRQSQNNSRWRLKSMRSIGTGEVINVSSACGKKQIITNTKIYSRHPMDLRDHHWTKSLTSPHPGAHSEVYMGNKILKKAPIQTDFFACHHGKGTVFPRQGYHKPGFEKTMLQHNPVILQNYQFILLSSGRNWQTLYSIVLTLLRGWTEEWGKKLEHYFCHDFACLVKE